MKICIHAGHNPDGKVACGAVGFGKESTLAREVCAYLEGYLMPYANVVNVTCDDGTSASDVLRKVVKRTNSEKPDLSISIHLNAGTTKEACGSEVCIIVETSECLAYRLIFAKSLENTAIIIEVQNQVKN